MKDIKIILYGGKEILTKIPQYYIKYDLIAYWVDVVCKEDVRGWIDYKIID